MRKIKNIVNGFSNLLLDQFGALAPHEQELALMRHNHCVSCVLRTGNKCNTKLSAPHIETGELQSGCGCNLAAKVRSKDSDCPLGKWKSVKNWVYAGFDTEHEKHEFFNTVSDESIFVEATSEESARIALYKLIK